MALAHHDPTGEWDEIRKHEETPPPEDLEVLHLLLTSLSQGARPKVFQQPLKGLGALGRPRWTVIANWHGGLVAREAKAAAPSAAAMPARPVRRTSDHRRIAAEARRAPDPAFLITERWVVRRLSPEARKIELGNFLPPSEKAGPQATSSASGGKPARPDPATGQLALLRAMGAEVANVHAGTAHDPDALLAWLAGATDGWLFKAAELASEQIARDHTAFRNDPGVVQLLGHA